jgi:hypothetical protein
MPKPNKPHQKPAQPAPAKPPRPFAVQLAADPGPFVGRQDLQNMLAERLPEEWKALQSAACQLHHWHEVACETAEESTATAAAELSAERAARALFGPGAVCTFQRDPRGLPLFVSWPSMPDRYRCQWEPERGLPIYLPADDYTE